MAAQMGQRANKLAERVLGGGYARLSPPEGRKDPAFLELWNRITNEFDPMYFLPADREILETYVLLNLEARDLESRLQEEGEIIEGLHGPKINPLSTLLTSKRRDVRSYAQMIRVGPSTRIQATGTKTSPGKRATGGATPVSFIPLAAPK